MSVTVPVSYTHLDVYKRQPQCADAALRNFLNRVVPKAVARADHVLADSESTRSDLIRLLGAPASKVTVVYPGVELSLIHI